VIGALLAVLAILVLITQAGPPPQRMPIEKKGAVKAAGYRLITVLGENNEPVTARVTFLDANGEVQTVTGSKAMVYGSFCAEAPGYLKSCSDGNVVQLIPDPEKNIATLTVICPGYFFIGPHGAPVLVKRYECNAPVQIPPGRYRLVSVTPDMKPVETMCIHPGPGERLTVHAQGHSCVVGSAGECNGEDVTILPLDAESGGRATVIYTDGKLAWRASEQNLWAGAARWVFLWGEGYKRASAYISPGERNATVLMLHQQGGGTLRIDTNAPVVAVIDINGAVLYFGEPRTIENVPPGSYRVIAYSGAAYAEVNVAVDNGAKTVEIARPRGTGTIVARSNVSIFAPGEYSWVLIAQGSGRITVPADTVLRVVLPDGKALETVVLPGEEKVI